MRVCSENYLCLNLRCFIYLLRDLGQGPYRWHKDNRGTCLLRFPWALRERKTLWYSVTPNYESKQCVGLGTHSLKLETSPLLWRWVLLWNHPAVSLPLRLSASHIEVPVQVLTDPASWKWGYGWRIKCLSPCHPWGRAGRSSGCTALAWPSPLSLSAFQVTKISCFFFFSKKGIRF